MTDHLDWDRLARYVSGESGATERADIERWAAGSDANRAMLESLRRRWNATSDGTPWNVDAAWSRLAPRLRDVKVEPGVIDLDTRRAARPSWIGPARVGLVAAAAVLLVAVAVRMRTVDSAPAGTTMALTSPEMRTGIGEQRTIDLADGSQVILGATSRLQMAAGFGEATREVFLEGQAFLRVRHDSTRPFVVNAGGTRATDMGTAFEVRAYPNEGVRVAVTEGMVEVHRDTGMPDSAVLQPGDVAELPEAGATVIRRQQNVERLLGWTRGELVFDDTPLSEVARDLERWYDVQVRIDDVALGALHLTTTLRIGDSLDEILNVVELALSSRGVRAERSGSVVTFRSGPPTPAANPPATRGRVEAGA
ncbi:MAG TPA: FecR domain-containing protein [Gemmatimonadaceae bacterium]